MIIQDKMTHTMHPCDGKYYDSKSEYHRVTLAHDSFEVGDNVDFEADARMRAQVGRQEDRFMDADLDMFLQGVYDDFAGDEMVMPFSPNEEYKPYFMI